MNKIIPFLCEPSWDLQLQLPNYLITFIDKFSEWELRTKPGDFLNSLGSLTYWLWSIQHLEKIQNLTKYFPLTSSRTLIMKSDLNSAFHEKETFLASIVMFSSLRGNFSIHFHSLSRDVYLLICLEVCFFKQRAGHREMFHWNRLGKYEKETQNIEIEYD